MQSMNQKQRMDKLNFHTKKVLNQLGLSFSNKKSSTHRFCLVPLIGREKVLIEYGNKSEFLNGMHIYNPNSTIMKKFKRIIVNYPWTRHFLYKINLVVSNNSPLNKMIDSYDFKLAISIGTPGVDSKSVIQIHNENLINSYYKVGYTQKAKDLIRNESKVLDMLSDYCFKFTIIPNLLMHYDLDEHMFCKQSALKFKSMSTYEINDVIIASLNELRFVGVRKKYSYNFDLCSDGFDEIRVAIEREVSKSNISSSFTHGDFTPWNMGFVKDKLYLFDWEYANANYFEGYDIIHYYMQVYQLIEKMSIVDTVRLLLDSPNELKLTSVIEERNLVTCILLYCIHRIDGGFINCNTDIGEMKNFFCDILELSESGELNV